jgi:hypothetical protein
MEETPAYDNLGLKTLDQAGKLHFISWQGDHLQIPEDGMEQIVKEFLSADEVDIELVIQL